jgi:16S rRNA (adenine1518-N6/adenine1519-N6)-dimethyltransferase
VEVDADLTAVLTELVDGLDVSVVNADAATLDWPALLGSVDNWHLVANLPYNVATPLVLDLLAGVPAVDRMLVMVQREVGDRLAAGPGSKDYGIPSVKVAYHARADVVGVVSAEVFLPRPRVESALVRLVRHDQPPVAADPEHMFDLVETAFRQRRKMLRRSLADRVGEAAFDRAGVAPTARPEELDLASWAALTDAVGR